MKMKVLCGAAVAALALMSGVVVAQSIQPGYALMATRSATEADYVNEFYCRTTIDGKEKFLTYGGGQTMSIATDEDEKLFSLTFIDNSTVTIKCGEYNLGYGGSGTNFSNTATKWVLENGSPTYMAGSTKRTLAYRTSTFNVGRPYALSNINNREYYQIYFLTKAELKTAENRCNWTDNNRRTQLTNLAYSLPIKCTVSFNPGLGSGTIAPIEIMEGQQIDAAPSSDGFNAPDGYDFDKWYIGENKAEFPLEITENITLTAHWKEHVEPAGIEEDESVDFTTQGYTNGQAVASYTGTNFTITFDKGTNSNPPKYYTSGTAIRCYGGNTITVSDNNLVRIVITFGSSDGTNEITTNVGTYENGTWIGSSNSVTFNIGGTSGNRRFTEITVTLSLKLQ